MSTKAEREVNRTALRGPGAQTPGAKWNRKYRDTRTRSGITVEEFIQRKRLEMLNLERKLTRTNWHETAHAAYSRPSQEYGGVW